LLAAGGSWLGFPIADPLIGLLIGVAILFITKDAAVTMWYRLMDAIEPERMAQAEGVLARQTGVKEARRLRMRWVGHRLHAEVYIAVDPHLTTAEGHQIAEQLRHDLFHEIPSLAEVVVHVDPWLDSRDAGHELTLHHESVPRPLQ
jgi:divalent metal cation (Fe/Co/Zn/Cd) transporter